ncbi:cyclic nucleotide-binding domain protein (macronuclear) [Tetrahymena thermophila SB210]|uniref:Cyclic nucleotide-binding domain protein n=1 Tax=Tetrahymena thermophila (strain SB210) TaxID=312017 RepID=I7MCK9_TETTS|nr:cyclic nucleotide-binding domain protein [Tetrahymena thermophila SB210]EAR84142.2 cyclic nucleotide-binding domain protein [Tetrahymena thermophila SB210]|eukprot:XP_001031805.2 cyclic nucleotide-binding domain protein [Tetrahymena thermophila SB210]
MHNKINMIDDQVSESDVLKQREKQSHLFAEKNDSNIDFKAINYRRDDSIIEKLDENTKDNECDLKLVEQNNLTFVSKEHIQVVNNSLKLTEREISSREPFQNHNSHNPRSKIYGKMDIQIKSQLVYQDGSPSKIRKTQQTAQQQDPRLQVVMRIKKQINKFFFNFTYNGRKINLQNQQCRKMINDLSDYTEVNTRFSTSQKKEVKSSVFITDQDHKEIQKQLIIIIRKYFIVQIINLIIKLFMVGHYIACLWQLVGVIDSKYFESKNSWIVTTYDFNEGIWWKVYVQAFSWAFTLMATGSNIASSVLELYFLSIVMPFTTIIFGYMINTIGIILSEIDLQEEFRRKDINIINKYMDRKQISQDLQARVNLDLEYFYQKNFKKMQEEEEGVLSKISEQLYRSLQYEYNMGIFKKMKNLYDNFSYQSLTQLCYKAQEITFSPNQIIFVENQISDSCLMYIISGQVQITQQVLVKMSEDKEESSSQIKDEEPNKIRQENYTQRVLGYLKEGQTFGDLNFFTGFGRNATIKSSAFTRILKIPRDQFMEIIQNNSKDLERYCEIRDQISLYSNYADLKFFCSICKKHDHLNNFCPLAHFDKKNPFIYARINFSDTQKRDHTFQRKRQYYRQFFNNLEEVQSQAREAQEFFAQIPEDEDEDYSNEYEEDEESNQSDHNPSQRSIPVSQKNQSKIIEKNDLDSEKQKSSIMDISQLPMKQQDDSNRKSMMHQKEENQSLVKIDTRSEIKKKSSRISIVAKEDLKEDHGHQRKKSQRQSHGISILHPDEKNTGYSNNQQVFIHNQTMHSNFSGQKPKDISYCNYNKSDEIIKDILLWNLDKIKQYNYYFSNGNFKAIMSKIQTIRKRQQSLKAKEKMQSLQGQQQNPRPSKNFISKKYIQQ